MPKVAQNLSSNLIALKAPTRAAKRGVDKNSDNDGLSFQKALAEATPKKANSEQPDRQEQVNSKPSDATSKKKRTDATQAKQNDERPVDESPTSDGSNPVDQPAHAQDETDKPTTSEPVADKPKVEEPTKAQDDEDVTAAVALAVAAAADQDKQPGATQPQPDPSQTAPEDVTKSAKPVARQAEAPQTPALPTGDAKPADAAPDKADAHQGVAVQPKATDKQPAQLSADQLKQHAVAAQQSSQSDSQPQQQQQQQPTAPTEPPARKVAGIAPQPSPQDASATQSNAAKQPHAKPVADDAAQQFAQLTNAAQQPSDGPVNPGASETKSDSSMTTSQAPIAGLADVAAAKTNTPNVTSSQPQAPAPPAHLPPEAEFASANHDQIVSSVRTQLMPNGGSMHMRLDPPELGVLQVTVRMVDGAMTASFETSNDQATSLLSHSLGQLKTALESQGVNVEKIHVQQSPRDQQADSRNSDEQNRQQRADDQSSARQEQQRREMLRRMWRRLGVGSDPLDMVA